MEYSFCPKCGGALESKVLKAFEPTRLVCSRCRFVFFLDPKVAAGALFKLDGSIVLLQRGIEPSYGKWVFPGGYVDRGETVEGAAIREVIALGEKDEQRVFGEALPLGLHLAA